MLLQASSAYSLKVQGWLREEALEWGSKIDADIAAKEKDTETIKQERQRDLMKLKVGVGRYICIARTAPETNASSAFCRLPVMQRRKSEGISRSLCQMHTSLMLDSHAASPLYHVVKGPVLWSVTSCQSCCCHIGNDDGFATVCELSIARIETSFTFGM